MGAGKCEYYSYISTQMTACGQRGQRRRQRHEERCLPRKSRRKDFACQGTTAAAATSAPLAAAVKIVCVKTVKAGSKLQKIYISRSRTLQKAAAATKLPLNIIIFLYASVTGTHTYVHTCVCVYC